MIKHPWRRNKQRSRAVSDKQVQFRAGVKAVFAADRIADQFPDGIDPLRIAVSDHVRDDMLSLARAIEEGKSGQSYLNYVQTHISHSR